jgi:hypothetical protein
MKNPLEAKQREIMTMLTHLPGIIWARVDRIQPHSVPERDDWISIQLLPRVFPNIQ